MRAKDLRIGNYLKVKGSETTEEVVELNFNSRKLGLIPLDSQIGMSWRYTEVEPIPLNEEWLIKFGLSKWKNKKIWSEKGFMIYQMKDGSFYFGNKTNRVKIKFVHSLQNLYFCLKQKELEL